jgi:hypothetical protein
MNRRPTPEWIAAKRWEIKRRYERQAKVGKRSHGMAAIRLSELTRWMHDVHGEGVELEPCDLSEMIIRIFTHHFMCLPHGPRRASSWFERYCPWLDLRDREYLISEATHCPLKWSADKLGWKLRLTDEQRSRLKIRTIGALGVGKEQRTQRRKQRNAELMRALRAKRKAARVSTI